MFITKRRFALRAEERILQGVASILCYNNIDNTIGSLCKQLERMIDYRRWEIFIKRCFPMFFPLSIFHKAKYQQLNPETLFYLTYENARVLMSN